MSDLHDYGPLRPYEITWTNGHVEVIWAHQVLVPHGVGVLFGDVPTKPRWTIHGEVDGHWQLLLTAPEEDIRIVREKSSEEVPR